VLKQIVTHNDRAYPMCITIHQVQTFNFVSSKWSFEKKMSRKLLHNCKIH